MWSSNLFDASNDAIYNRTLVQVKLSMNRIKQVMSQRAHNEYDNPQVKAKLLAFVNAL